MRKTVTKTSRVKWEVIQWCWFHKYPAALAAGSGNPCGAQWRSHTACFLQEGRRASRKLLDTNNRSGKDSDSVTGRGEDSWVHGAGPGYSLQTARSGLAGGPALDGGWGSNTEKSSGVNVRTDRVIGSLWMQLPVDCIQVGIIWDQILSSS